MKTIPFSTALLLLALSASAQTKTLPKVTPDFIIGIATTMTNEWHFSSAEDDGGAAARLLTRRNEPDAVIVNLRWMTVITTNALRYQKPPIGGVEFISASSNLVATITYTNRSGQTPQPVSTNITLDSYPIYPIRIRAFHFEQVRVYDDK